MPADDHDTLFGIRFKYYVIYFSSLLFVVVVAAFILLCRIASPESEEVNKAFRITFSFLQHPGSIAIMSGCFSAIILALIRFIVIQENKVARRINHIAREILPEEKKM